LVAGENGQFRGSSGWPRTWNWTWHWPWHWPWLWMERSKQACTGRMVSASAGKQKGRVAWAELVVMCELSYSDFFFQIFFRFLSIFLSIFFETFFLIFSYLTFFLFSVNKTVERKSNKLKIGDWKSKNLKIVTEL
jgi:hypothetical protein